ncbi:MULTISPECIES: hypothetical protein [Clostridium]|uniref:hypothetical protein n=1 Tax=Clostridium TaxID=1485 RepID=UPI000826FF3B|nr:MULTISPECIES: hypothetical protein [Clostridium]PJI10152.1 hypothetical protein CUB90_20755 [Clostridium sp. CT7]
MKKMCVLDENKVCDNCGECDRCDLNPEKICDNCGKCLNPNNANTRSILVDNVIPDDDNINEAKDSDDSNEILHDYDDDYVKDENDDYDEPEIDFINDVDGLNEILNDEEKRKKFINEAFPGFLTLRKDKFNK